MVHNRYRRSGGEGMVVRAERGLLVNHGHEVHLLEADNAEIIGLRNRVRAALGTVYSRTAKKNLAEQITRFRPEIVHVHNFFPLLSPSIYYACQEAGVPVAQTLHNYRLVCPNAQLLRNGRICEDCIGKKIPWPGVLHACYRGSRAGSVAVASMITVHRRMSTWDRAVDMFVALTDFSRNKLVEGGLPAKKITVKPNCSPDPGPPGGDPRGGFALFVGRLSPEKGVGTLLSAWEDLGVSIPLKMAGDGPLREEVARRADGKRIEYLGRRSHKEILALMRQAAIIVFPSIWYECFPLVIVEAFACGLPVIASQMGAMGEIIDNGRTGLHFRPGDTEDLAAKIKWAVCHPEEMVQMRHASRSEYLAKYTPERNYQMLMGIYEDAIRRVADHVAS